MVLVPYLINTWYGTDVDTVLYQYTVWCGMLVQFFFDFLVFLDLKLVFYDFFYCFEVQIDKQDFKCCPASNYYNIF